MAASHHANLHAYLRRLEKRLPQFGARAVRCLRTSSAWVRTPFALLLIVGGCLGFLPILGFWMLPLGIILIALDVTFLQPPLAVAIKRVETWWSR